ncbi:MULTISPECIES: prolipoprotein diacylglyceryl transferase family protein [Pseudomonas]|uniref:prolipoprotein diacylglyceryl transferase family protein n=1 Tax=Pseudomonas TaxID=286 RepID=UPI003340546A
MMIYWSFNPILASIGPFSIHWYGVLFVGAFLMAKFVMARIFKAEDVPEELAERLFYFALVGGIVGARLAHCLFYDPAITCPTRWRYCAFGRAVSRVMAV